MVYLGKHVVLPRAAAIKVMLEGQPRAVAVRMLREACLVEALSHPGIPRVYECGVLADRRPWMAFEHVEGDSIGATMAVGPMAVADVVVVVREVADLLDHIHRRGIVHHGLTAEAIVRTADRRSPVCVRSWGAACALDSSNREMVDPREDVRALGVIAFRALTGALPEPGVGPERYGGVPLDVTTLIDAMLADEPAARPSSSEVRERASWLASTLELVSAQDRPRWTPPRGLTPESLPATAGEPGDGFAIRIAGSRSPTR